MGVLLVIAVLTILLTVRERRQSRRAEAIQLALKGKMDAAAPLLAEALALDASDGEVLRAQAIGHLAAGDLDEAELAAQRWRTARPDEIESHLFLIDVSLRRNRLVGAIDGAGAALKLRPSALDLRQQYATWLYLVGRTDEADAECRRCRETRPDHPGLALLQADICMRLGDHVRAEGLLDDLLRQQPGLAPAQARRGAVYLETNQPQQAIPLLRQALAQNGEHQQRTRHYLSLALARTGQEDEARRVLAEVKKHQTMELWTKYGKPDTAAYKVSIAESLLETGQADEAVRLLEQLLSQSPNCAAAHRLLALHYEAQGQHARAAEHRRKAGE
jgi:predicted Zn-dependent protease